MKRLVLAMFVVLLAVPGCGPSKEEQAVDAYNRGLGYARTGEHDKAIADFTEAITLDPKNAEVYYRGSAYRHMGERVKAEADLTRAKELGLNPPPRSQP